jgi:hypothetical protein
MKNYISNIAALMTIILLVGCAAPQHVVRQASEVLVGNCKELFLSERNGGYQHVAQIHLNGKAVFAIAIEKGQQKCGMARSSFDLPHQGNAFANPGSVAGWEQLEVIAISRCEQSSNIVKVPCKIYARNNDIVWGKNSEINFK